MTLDLDQYTQGEILYLPTQSDFYKVMLVGHENTLYLAFNNTSIERHSNIYKVVLRYLGVDDYEEIIVKGEKIPKTEFGNGLLVAAGSIFIRKGKSDLTITSEPSVHYNDHRFNTSHVNKLNELDLGKTFVFKR